MSLDKACPKKRNSANRLACKQKPTSETQQEKVTTGKLFAALRNLRAP